MKILIIGAHGYELSGEDVQVRSIGWNRLRSISNLANFDRVVVMMGSLPSPDRLDSAAIDDVFSLESVARVLLNDGHIVILGDHRKLVDKETESSSGRESSRSYTRTFLDLFRLGIGTDDRSGDNVIHQDRYRLPDGLKPYSEYSKHLLSWEYSVSSINPDLDPYALHCPYRFDPGPHISGRLQIRRVPFVLTRYNTRVAESFTFVIEYFDRFASLDELGNTVPSEVLELGSLVLLPEIRSNRVDSVELLMSEVFGVEVQTPEPEWIEKLVAPGQMAIDAEISATQAEIERLRGTLDELWNRRDTARSPLRLLYAMGTELEEAVIEVFETLGAKPISLEANNRADSLMSVSIDGEIKHVAVEVKGTTRSTFDTKGLRQLNEWKMEIAEQRSTEAKGLLVGNSAIEMPPEARESPFSGNLQRTAAIQRHAMMTSATLYKCYVLNIAETLDVETFWRTILHEYGELSEDMLIRDMDINSRH